MIKEGTWWVESKKDPRWNNEGRGVGSGLFGPNEMEDWIEECKEKYGEPPKDARCGFIKD